MGKTGFAILYQAAMVCLVCAGTAQSQAALLDSFENPDSLANWKLVYGASARPGCV